MHLPPETRTVSLWTAAPPATQGPPRPWAWRLPPRSSSGTPASSRLEHAPPGSVGGAARLPKAAVGYKQRPHTKRVPGPRGKAAPW